MIKHGSTTLAEIAYINGITEEEVLILWNESKK